MDPVTPLLLLLKGLLHGMVAKIPDLATAAARDTSTRRELEQFRTDVHYFLDVVDRMDARHGINMRQPLLAQQQTIERQMEIIEALIGKLAPISQQLDSLVSTRLLPSPVTSSDTASYERLARFMTDARQQLHSDFQQAAELASPEESLDVLARLVRWQMTDAPYLQGHSASARRDDWLILAYRYMQYIYYVAVSGTDPASAHVRYLRSIPRFTPYTDSEWQDVLSAGSQRFDDFVPLPGSGIYDLITRLAANGVHAD